ncbi:MAG: ion transporter [Flammeovirgaceae bacterium]
MVSAKNKKKTELSGNSLGFMTPNSYFRRFCLFIYNLPHFDDFSNVMVVFSTILLVIDNPLDDPHSKKQFVLAILDYITTAVFSVECFVKICVFGLLVNGKKSYFREPWNFLDFFVVLVSLFSYLPLGFDMKFYKSMRLLRILRPLRMI